ncbi:MAG: membrane protein insertion efficiency factor YidD [Bdellovibrionales bacterium]|nr:membrane protein insertion efficiency factor YidD [Bdellovibrionales bacterium]
MRFLIKIYQWLISPLLAPSCRFYPTCSQYAYDALSRHHFFRAIQLIGCRVIKCQPFHPGGYDPVPKNMSECTRKLATDYKSEFHHYEP